MASDAYDFIVVGGGSAGAVVAARLSEDPDVTVLLLEAGGPEPSSPLAEINVPAAAGKLQRNPAVDWCFKTTEQQKACQLNDGKQALWPRGKVLGGSSSINYMAYVRGTPSDYDSWAAAGAAGWSYKDVLPYFLKSEDCRNTNGRVPSSAAIIDDALHGTDGPLTTSIREPVNPIAEAFVAACNEAGHRTVDYNGGAEEGASLFQLTIRDGKRCSTATAFLQPARQRTNLTIKTHCTVTKVTVSVDGPQKIADGVECVLGKSADPKAERTVFKARKEVVLSAGAIGSPHILLLSGIGDQAALAQVGVACVLHLPGVGTNLQDHLMLPMAFRPGYEGYEELTSRSRNTHKQFLGKEQRDELASLKTRLGKELHFKDIGAVNAAKAATIPSLWAYLTEGKGPLVSASYDAHLLLRTGLNDDLGKFPDIQVGLFVGVADESSLKNLNFTDMEAMGIDEHDLGATAQGFTVLPTLLHPRSRGWLKLSTSNPFDQPEIEPNYLTDDRDVKTLIAGCKHASSLVTDCESLSKLAAFAPAHPLLHPHIDAGTDIINDDVVLEEMVRGMAATLYHPTSTCSIGIVVDPTLCVIGIEGLRVIDASIMPHLPSANTNAPTIMIGEKGADMIAAKHKLNQTVGTTKVIPTDHSFGRQAAFVFVAILIGLLAMHLRAWV